MATESRRSPVVGRRDPDRPDAPFAGGAVKEPAQRALLTRFTVLLLARRMAPVRAGTPRYTPIRGNTGVRCPVVSTFTNGALHLEFNVVTTIKTFFLGCNNLIPTINANGTATYTFTAATIAAEAARSRPERSHPSTS